MKGLIFSILFFLTSVISIAQNDSRYFMGLGYYQAHIQNSIPSFSHKRLLNIQNQAFPNLWIPGLYKNHVLFKSNHNLFNHNLPIQINGNSMGILGIKSSIKHKKGRFRILATQNLFTANKNGDSFNELPKSASVQFSYYHRLLEDRLKLIFIGSHFNENYNNSIKDKSEATRFKSQFRYGDNFQSKMRFKISHQYEVGSLYFNTYSYDIHNQRVDLDISRKIKKKIDLYDIGLKGGIILNNEMFRGKKLYQNQVFITTKINGLYRVSNKSKVKIKPNVGYNNLLGIYGDLKSLIEYHPSYHSQLKLLLEYDKKVVNPLFPWQNFLRTNKAINLGFDYFQEEKIYGGFGYLGRFYNWKGLNITLAANYSHYISRPVLFLDPNRVNIFQSENSSKLSVVSKFKGIITRSWQPEFWLRYVSDKAELNGEMTQLPFDPKFQIYINSKWRMPFDWRFLWNRQEDVQYTAITTGIIGFKHLPNPNLDPINYLSLNQVLKVKFKKTELNVGIHNIFNYKQVLNNISSSELSSSSLSAPIQVSPFFGRNYSLGIKVRLN